MLSEWVQEEAECQFGASPGEGVTVSGERWNTELGDGYVSQMPHRGPGGEGAAGKMSVLGLQDGKHEEGRVWRWLLRRLIGDPSFKTLILGFPFWGLVPGCTQAGWAAWDAGAEGQAELQGEAREGAHKLFLL